ncbi:bifunctional folylpolyglutamate synthase/dihydrofolate synthase [Kocuria carniphila]|uniref:bifunctional folylpolyglutamate synthase/dihydrofolate synthase n=1 Tax=Kocuria carniphila TaxID=262208 RepID=UPI0021A65AF1|nr:folylpolyglutamate synthase/dihydrofolate synthase family protein [Kocuria carniphila]MCT1802936.1 bifunctional folylpolyglutamate synthase/dihydrofolate synthase [Kocuria carniphila]
MSTPQSVEEVYSELLDRAPENKMEPRLDAVQRAVDILGNPEKSAPVIHITGTNGKTSTARMVESLLLAHDLRVGRYTSPHLEKVTERISLDGRPVTDETFVRIYGEIAPYLQLVDTELSERGEPRLTFFEVLTVLAFAVFADEPVDVMVLEVGIGGSWDATNVADAAVSIVTPVDLDHTEMLGDTLQDIALEKAGIIKPGGFLISAAQDPVVAQILLERAQEIGAQFRFEGVEFGVRGRTIAVGGQIIAVQGLAAEYIDLMLPLFGEHQAENAALAIAAVEALLGGGDKPLNQELLVTGLGAVTSPGRLELARKAPPVLLDAAHNPHGLKASARAVRESFTFAKLNLVVGILREKDVETMLRTLAEEYSEYELELWCSHSRSPRAIAPEELAEIAADMGFDEDMVHAQDRLDDAIASAIQDAADRQEFDGAVLITGSVTVVGEARALLGL